MTTSVLAVLSLATVAAAMVHGSTTTLEITASDKDTGAWMAKMGDTKVAVEHKHLEGSVGSGEWTLKLSQSSDLDANNDISEDKKLQQRDTPMEVSPEETVGTQAMPQQDSYALPPATGIAGPSSWEFQQRTLPETLTPPGVYQDTSYLPIRLESPSAPDTMLRPPPALPPFSYNMAPRQAQPLMYPNAPSVGPNRIQRGFMAPPLQPYNTLRYESEYPSYNIPASVPKFEDNNIERTYYINDIVQPNGAQQSYLPLWQSPESHAMSMPQQQDSYMPGSFAGQQNYFPHNDQRHPEPINTYQYTAVIIPNAEEPTVMDQSTGKTEYSSGVQNRMFNNPDPAMLQATQNQHFDTIMPFLYASNSMPDSLNVHPQEVQTAAGTDDQNSNSVPEQSPDSGYASDPDTEQKYVIVEALVMSNPETASVQELSRGENADQPLSYSPNFAHRVYNEDIEGLKVPQPLPLFVDERMQKSPKLISDYSAPSYGMTPPSMTQDRNANENEVVPEYKEVQDYHPYIADIAFRPIQEADRAISYMPTSVIKEEESARVDTTTPDNATGSEMKK